MLDYKLLEALAMVVEEGGFEKAARSLHLTQSAVSQRVRQLEEQRGQILLVRSSPPRPTPAGQLLLKHFRQVRMLEGGLGPGEGCEHYSDTLAVAINADSLATWFLPVVEAFVHEHHVLLDLVTDDQDETHKLLRNGDVVGCVSARAESMQGCCATYLGCMDYRLLASPEFAAHWFPKGVTAEAAGNAPAVTFNRMDESVHTLLRDILGPAAPAVHPTHYVPSSERFAQVIVRSWGYGALPDCQSSEHLISGALVDLAPGHVQPVRLYWHCWNLDSPLLRALTAALVKAAPAMLSV
ncbi:LysR family transcriptional regulator ArgP [Desulfocurvus sp. DL9XJH121]